MLNYIWAGLIVSSFLFALGYDIRDISGDRYRNGKPLAVELTYPEGQDPSARRVPVVIRIEPGQYTSFYGAEQVPDSSYPATCCRRRRGRSCDSPPDPSCPSRSRPSPRSPARAMKSSRVDW